jgi:3,4-dihydroxy 2-butanone 4-phosphate synthase / GTP cyclohydrolase II
MFKKTDIVQMPTVFGKFKFLVYHNLSNNQEIAVIFKGDWKAHDEVLVRLHSSCVTGDIFSSLRCDCGPQLHKTLEMINNESTGMVIYLPQEGRGIGLFNKIKAYKLQEEGLDTVEANIKLGFEPDQREYSFVEDILKDMGITKVKLITNNPDKIEKLAKLGINIVKRVEIKTQGNEFNSKYLETKRQKMGHLL